MLQWIASYASSTRIRTALTVEFALPMGRSYSLFRARGNNNKPAATEDSNPRQAFQLREAPVRGCGQARTAHQNDGGFRDLLVPACTDSAKRTGRETRETVDHDQRYIGHEGAEAP